MKPDVTTFFDEATWTATHVVADPATGRCAIVDPVLDFTPSSGRTARHSVDRVIGFVTERGLTVDWVLETHVHADHLSATPVVKAALGGRSAIGERVVVVQQTFARLFNVGPDFATDGSQFDKLFGDGETFRVGTLCGRVMLTPGHTPACATYLIGDAVFVGDTLFMPDFGTARCDFPGGDARDLYRSIQRILALPGETRMFLCHDYKAPGRGAFAWQTTVAEQRRANIHVHEGWAEDEFVATRTARDAGLAVPNLMLPALQVNMRAGELPPPEHNGTRYLKIPLDAL